MKKPLFFFFMTQLTLTLSACGNDPENILSPEQDNPSNLSIKMTVGDQMVTASLKDNTTARDFLSHLPIEVTLQDYAGAEKIFYPNPALTTKGAPMGLIPLRGDIALYEPWGNVCIFYRNGNQSNHLIHLGHIDEEGIEVFDIPDSIIIKIEKQ